MKELFVLSYIINKEQKVARFNATFQKKYIFLSFLLTSFKCIDVRANL